MLFFLFLLKCLFSDNIAIFVVTKNSSDILAVSAYHTKTDKKKHSVFDYRVSIKIEKEISKANEA